MAETPVAPNTIQGQFNQYTKPVIDDYIKPAINNYIQPALETIRVPQPGEPGYQNPDPTAVPVPTLKSEQAANIIPQPQLSVPGQQLVNNTVFKGTIPADFAGNEALAQQTAKDAKDVANLQFPSDAAKPAGEPVKKPNDPFAALNMQLGAQEDLNKAAQTLEGAKQSQLQKEAGMQQQRIDQFKTIKTDYDNQVKQRMGEIDSELKQVEKDAIANRQTIGDLWNNKSTGQKVAAGIAMILGAASGVLDKTGNNPGLTIIQNALENDKKQLMQNFANSKEMLQLKKSNMDEYMKAMSAKEAMADRQQLLQTQLVQTKLGQAESVYRGSASAANAKNAGALIEMQKQAMIANQTQQAVLQNMIKSGNLPNPLQAAAMGLPKQITEGIDATRGLMVEGYQGVANNKEDRDQFQKFRQTAEPSINALNRILELQKTGNRLSPEERAKVTSEVNAAIGALREPIVGPGAMTEQEYERIKNTIGDPNKLFSLPSWEKAKASTALNKIKSDLTTVAKLRGFVPPQNMQGTFKSGSDAESIFKKYVK